MENLSVVQREARDSIVANLKGHGLEVFSEPVISGMQPDLVAFDPATGQQFIVELQLGRGDASLSALGQMTKLRTAIRNGSGPKVADEAVNAVLVTNLAIEPDIQAFADTLDVTILRVEPSTETIVNSVVGQISTGAVA